MAGYIGGKVAVSAPQQIETKHTITATASQTSIPNVGYTVGAVHVYQNGIRLVDGTDYTATNGSTVTLETGATEGDQIVIVSHGSFETSDTVSKASGGTFSGNVAVSGSVTATGSVTANSLVVPDGSIPLVDLDIDGGTDIGAALVDADLMVVDDGAGGTNRKATMSRLATYMGTKISTYRTLISTTTISDDATVLIEGLDNTYDRYQFVITDLLNATTTNTVLMRFKSGGSIDTTSGNYNFGNLEARSNSNSATVDSSNDYGTYISVTDSMDTAAPDAALVIFDIFDPAGTTHSTKGFGTTIQPRDTVVYTMRHGFAYEPTAAVTGVQLMAAAGNMGSGTIKLYGIT